MKRLCLSLVMMISIIACCQNTEAKSQNIHEEMWTSAEQADLETVKELVGKGADVNYTDFRGQTALHAVARKGHLEIAKYLIENKSKINLQDKQGWTPLHYACFGGHLEIVKLLLKNGADKKIKSTYSGVIPKDSTPLDVAKKMNRKDVVEFLSKK